METKSNINIELFEALIVCRTQLELALKRLSINKNDDCKAIGYYNAITMANDIINKCENNDIIIEK